MAVDGSIGPKTQQALQKFNIHQNHMNTPDPETRDMQVLLSNSGYKNADGTPLKVDGIHGPNTDAAINAFENDFLGQVVPNYTPKTVQKTVFPKVPNLNKVTTTDTPNSSSTSLTDGWGQPMAYTGKSVLQQTQDEQYKTNYGTGAIDVPNDVQNTSGTFVQPLPAATMPININTAQKSSDNAVTRISGSGQDSGYKPGNSVVDVNKIFNDYNRNAGLNKSKFLEVANTINDPVNTVDMAHDKGKNLAIDMYGYGESLPHNAGAGLACDMYGKGTVVIKGGGLTPYDQNQYQLYKTLGGQESKYEWEYDGGKDVP
ncbi:MAG: hypothetical protein WCP73_08310, partial [Eubacteriales bacterium]